MAAEEEPDEIERTVREKTSRAGRTESGRSSSGREPHLAGLVWIFPAQQGQRVSRRWMAMSGDGLRSLLEKRRG